MRLYAHLLFTIFVLHARAASIPGSTAPELGKKVPSILPEETKLPTKNVSSEQELIDPITTVKDVENNIRNSINAVEDIPVKVIIDEVLPALRTNSEEKEIINKLHEEEDIKRPLVDLRNPGPPQRQEHETQNPEHHEEADRSVTSVKQNIRETQLILQQGFQGVTDDIKNWYVNNEQVNKLQSSIEALKDSFSDQVQKLNETLNNLVESKPVQASVDESNTIVSYQNIESRLKILQNNFNTGMKTLTEGVQVVATLRAEGENAAGSQPAATTSTTAPTANPGFPNPMNLIMQMMDNLQTSVTSAMSNATQAINNLFPNFNNQSWNLPWSNLIPGSSTIAPQADDVTSLTTSRPSPLQSIQNIFNFNQAQQNQTSQPTPAASQGPFAVIANMSNQFFQNFQNLINRPSQATDKPAEASSASPISSATGSNEVPATPAKPIEPKPEPENKPEAEKKPEPANKPQQSTGPIRQILENNPVVQGLASAVQRIQTTINNPEKPRDTAEKNETEQEKDDLIFVDGHGHRGGHGSGSGDNNDSGSGLKSETEDQKEVDTEQKIDIKEETPTDTVSDKTE